MERGTSSRRWGIIILLIVIIGAAAYAYHVFSAKPLTGYITAVAEKRNLEQTVLADGTIEAQKQVSVGAQVSGQIKVLHVALGDKVKKGQLIAEIDDLTQQNSLKDSEAALKNVEAQHASKIAMLRNDKLAFERQGKILAKGVGAQADFDSARATFDATQADIKALEAQIAQAQIAVSTAQLNLGYTKISSPIDGTVVAIPVEEGQTVNAVQSTPTIIKVAHLDTMTIEAQISEADVIKVKTGMPVYFTILGQPEKRYNATLRAIEPAPDSINDNTTTSLSSSSSSSSTSTAIYYNGLFDVANPDGVLRISMTAQVYIILQSEKEAIVVPATALDHDGQKTTVQVVDAKGNISRRTVTVGINNNVDAQILSGVQEGEQVIVSQGSTTAAGMRHMGPPRGM
ncbi:efflux RND transporter periplasmic adaptor subunit [Edaphovirga cremea]|uniref:efflux RND transporter periplasmic adaptor subunit n=1 Tax=Edaphovirga cremea TaxID=2267246 RepID=UPI003989AE9E